ncbi:MAG TPA: threonine synthase [Casimicrobiaceae bacterium]|nr:threonine synthase [Casimicrobiaceae bacterium]
MDYVSTRGAWADAPQPFSAILLEGLAPDGGLALPRSYPRVHAGELAAMRTMAYPELAFTILARYADDIAPADLRTLVAGTYTAATFGSDAIAPLSTLAPGLHLLHVSNGPTLSFKDIALQMLGALFEYTLERQGRRLNILGATSGDTGSSAEVAMLGKRRAAVFMLSPWQRMSAFQQAQMYAIDAPNIHNLAIEGTFDDCQDIVKAINAEAAFKSQHALGAVNSINWARIAAQAVYYFKAYFAATQNNADVIDFVVPSGNFGNVFAGHVARAMGLPIRRLIVATNENDVLDEFFRSGIYRPRDGAETHATSSPSMDIAKASNFERFVADICGRDAAVVRDLWQQLAMRGHFDLATTPYWSRVQDTGMVSGRSTHAERVATIREVDRRYGVTIDPHTADGLGVGMRLREPGVPLVAIETALPAKFAATITEALGRTPPRPAAYDGLESRPQHYTRLGVDVAGVRDYIARHAIAA